MKKIVAFSDSHCEPINSILGDVSADILIFAGDATFRGTHEEFRKVFWELRQVQKNFGNVVWVNGNHDFLFQDDPEAAQALVPPGVIVLNNTEAQVQGLKIWGSPWTTKFYDWAFMKSQKEIRKTWEQIPSNLDILITHGPPAGILDQNDRGDHCGDYELESIVGRELVKAPLHHFFGHIHVGNGRPTYFYNGRTHFHNVSIMNEQYFPENPYTEVYIDNT